MMIVSIGLALFLRNFFLFFYGGDKKAYAEFAGLAGHASSDRSSSLRRTSCRWSSP